MAAHEAKKVSRLIEFHGFLPFLRRICALIPIPVDPIAPRIREAPPEPSKAETACESLRGKALKKPGLPAHARGEAAEPAFLTLADVDATLTDAGQRLLHARLICGRAAPLLRLPWPLPSTIVRATAARRARGT